MRFPNDESIKIIPADRQAAQRALARNWPDLKPENPKYKAFLSALAEFHHRFGADSFELRYNLRPPKSRTEEWTRQFFQGQITEDQLRSKLQEDANRPIDLEMLTTCYDAFQDNLSHYSGALQQSVILPSESDTSAGMEHERAIDIHVAALEAKLPLYKENLETVFEFLEERRIVSGAGLVKLKEFEGTSAHWLAILIFRRMTEAWKSCKEISLRSQRDPRYIYAASAIDLFAAQWLPTFPTPQSIGERLREEFILARTVLRTVQNPTTAAEPTTTEGNNSWSIDNESLELTSIGDMMSVVARAGHVFCPKPLSDWGIDGEIEFKDGKGWPSGRRVYVQLKSGDSHLSKRRSDGNEIFTVKNPRHIDYWQQQAYPVMLVIRASNGTMRWMDIGNYLKTQKSKSRQVIFQGESVTVETIRQLAKKQLGEDGNDNIKMNG